MPNRRDNEMLEQLGRRVSQLRRDRGITQAKLAAAIGVETVSLSRLETGERGLSLSTLAKVADKLGVSLGDIVDSARPLRPLDADPVLTQIAHTAEDLSAAGRAALLNMAHELVKLSPRDPSDR